MFWNRDDIRMPCSIYEHFLHTKSQYVGYIRSSTIKTWSKIDVSRMEFSILGIDLIDFKRAQSERAGLKGGQRVGPTLFGRSREGLFRPAFGGRQRVNVTCHQILIVRRCFVTVLSIKINNPTCQKQTWMSRICGFQQSCIFKISGFVAAVHVCRFQAIRPSIPLFSTTWTTRE